MSDYTIYLVPGVATDRRVFRELDLQGRTFKYLDWLRPHRKESIQQYAARMAERIDPHSRPILVGYSFGGMVSIEMAKQIDPVATIIMASIKHYQERPMRMLLGSMTGLHKVVPSRIGKYFSPVYKYMAGPRNEAEHRYVEMCAREMDPFHTDWAFRQAVAWRNTWQPRRLYHIQGTEDRIFPYRYIQNAIPIQGGSHLMLLNQADEINGHVNGIIDRIAQENMGISA